MGDDQTRLTIRLPSHKIEELRDELDSFNTDAARFQFLVHSYLDYKQVGAVRQPMCRPVCNCSHAPPEEFQSEESNGSGPSQTDD
jgi:hypothetical protein